jgi:predicted phosphodiesterase
VLPAPWLAVPGNHDIPLFDLPRRLIWPRERYWRWIGWERWSLSVVDGARVLGLDSSRRRTTGVLTPKRLEPLPLMLRGPQDELRVVVTHHPFIPKQLLGATGALEAAALARVDVLLAGHQHLSYHRRIAQDPGLGILLVQAGTATSFRRRKKEPSNSFNVLRWDGSVLAVELRTFDGEAFTPARTNRFRRGEDGWTGA